MLPLAPLALSSWSVHRALGPVFPGLDPTAADRPPENRYGPGTLSLLDLPAAVRDAGISLLEICHFHFPRTDAAYLATFRANLDAAGVQLLTLLIDDGDISAADAEARERDLAHIRGWVDIAAALGARQVRVVAGEATAGVGDPAIRRSGEGLAALAAYASSQGVGVVTENWHALAMPPENVLAILDQVNGANETVGLCADFGNYTGPGKYDALAAILPRATSVHAKAAFPRAGEPDTADFTHCLALTRNAGVTGPHVLIFDGPGDEWTSIAQIGDIVRDFYSAV